MAPLPIETRGTHQHITTPSLFLLFQELFTITKVMEQIFEVNANEDIEDMGIFDFTYCLPVTP